MTGYNQHGFDPNAYEQPGPPLRPYNKVQWAGFVIATIGMVLELIYWAGRLGWIAPLLDDRPMAFVLVLLGLLLVYSRRQPGTDLAPELAPARRRWLIIVAGLCAAILGFAAVIEIQGAN